MLALLLAITIELVPNADVGVKTELFPRNPARVADVMSWSRSLRFDGSYYVLEHLTNNYCVPVNFIRARKGQIFPLRTNMDARYLQRIFRRARAGKPVYFSRVDRVPYSVAVYAMINTQYEFVGEGFVDLDILQRSCLPE